MKRNVTEFGLLLFIHSDGTILKIIRKVCEASCFFHSSCDLFHDSPDFLIFDYFSVRVERVEEFRS